MFFHPVPDGVHHSLFFFVTDHCIYLFIYLFLLCDHFSPRPDLTPSSHARFLTFISIVPTLVPYSLSPIDLATILTTYPTNLVTLLITYPTNLTTILTTYPIDLATLHTQPFY